ncbi:Swt1 family HEPN domain-containing protein [Flavobacterium sp. LHD-85]|uniref:Swt1 family HEPN domain-containing protein n=1 Tax=Flavobacterium sp. LHD-85 TaxID=3071410 RepID=UPI0027E18BB0|nr:Swt1 family HEPN domain-containing protein [Flavobacterium sp. LHD-85]MDQ6531167.1 Swt1 family HEPN domain-containing protein [Flavobacterium sp. LHD-85]
MNWKSPSHIEENKYELPGNWLKIEYFEALNILFRFENSLRVFVYIILKNELKEKWCELSITSDDEEKSTINAIAKRRISQDKNYAYLGYVLNSQLLHLTSGELIRIITSDNYWKFFKNYFLGTKEIIKNKLDEIGNVRNAVAHFRPIKKGDIELIKQNSNHTLSQIEKTIQDFISCPDIVPTNTTENWYKELKTVENLECSVNFRQSKNEEWVKLILTFYPPVLHREDFYGSQGLKTLNIKVTQLLIKYKAFTNQTICVNEYVPNINSKDANSINPYKEIRFTFSRKNLEKNYAEIKLQLDEIILQISNEVDLITNDNLARGAMIEVVNTYVEKNHSKLFSWDNSQFFTELDENSPVEYWGRLNYPTSSFVTDTEQYPWMPVTISEDKDLPF